MPSGPEALAGLRRVSFFRTLNSVTVGGLVCCTSPDASGCSGEKGVHRGEERVVSGVSKGRKSQALSQSVSRLKSGQHALLIASRRAF